MENKANVKFCFKVGKNATEIFLLLKKYMVINEWSCINVFGRFDISQWSRMRLNDGEHSDRPRTARTQKIIEIMGQKPQ